MNFRIYSFIITAIFPFAIKAQVNKSLWLTIQLPVKMSKKITWHNDAGYRTLDYSFSARQHLYRTGLRYHFTKQTDAAAGFALFYTRTSDVRQNHEFGQEARMWQEVVHQQSLLKNTSLLLRLRTEQRFFKETSIQKTFHAFRFRYRVNFQQQLHEKWILQLGYEHMHQLQQKKFEFHLLRVQPSILYKLNEKIQVQAMYMYMKNPNENLHVLWMTYSLKIENASRN